MNKIRAIIQENNDGACYQTLLSAIPRQERKYLSIRTKIN
jgi:hypothetical protein|tara:strand:- start:601 stop:720 length:120 start_codon:yes stop_codon:yes gene_type:complete